MSGYFPLRVRLGPSVSDRSGAGVHAAVRGEAWMARYQAKYGPVEGWA